MIIQTRQIAFAGASFGARSYTTPQKDCWVSDFDGKPGGWEAYCDCMFPASDPNRAKCRKHPCANPFDPNPDCIGPSVDPRWLSAPWTEIGAGIRGIPKEGGGLLYLFAGASRPVELWELEPDNFLQIADADPLRGAILIAEAEKVLASPAAGTYPWAKPRTGMDGRQMLRLHYALGGGIFSQIPIVGGVLTAVKAAELFLPVGPLSAWMTHAARDYAFVKDPTGELYAAKVKPITDRRGGDVFALVGGAASAFGGDPVPMIVYFCKNAARLLPTGPNVAQDVKIARAMLLAAAKIAPKIAELIKDPQVALQSDTLYVDFGNQIAAVAKELKPVLDQQVYDVLLGLGDLLRYFAPSIAICAQSIASNNFNLLCCGPDTAFDYLPYKVPGLGFKISTMVGIAQDVAKSGQQTAGQIQSLILNGDNAKSGLQTIQQLFGAVALFGRELNKALAAFKPVGQFFSGAIEKLLGQKAEFDKFVTQAQQNAASGETPAQAVIGAATSRKLLRPVIQDGLPPGLFIPGLVHLLPGPGTTPSTPPVTTPPATPAPAGGALAPVLLGAGAGFAIAGPIGALVGAGALALLKK